MTEYARWSSFTAGELIVLNIALGELEDQDPCEHGARMHREISRELKLRGRAARETRTAHELHTKPTKFQ